MRAGANGAARTLRLVREQIDRVDPSLEELLASWRPPLGRLGPVAVTGAGGSEGPARVLEALLRDRRRPARFVPLSSFATGQERGDGETLIVLSQGLCANARIALQAQGFSRLVLLTSVRPDREAAPGTPASVAARVQRNGGTVVVLPPAVGSTMLVRFVGPTVASLAAVLIAAEGDRPPWGARDQLGALPGRRRDAATRMQRLLARARPFDPPERLALVTVGDGVSYAHGLRWKLLEGLGTVDPPVWDVLQVAHGPFQQFFNGKMMLLGLCDGADARQGRLFDRLERMLVPDRHRLLRLSASTPGPLGWFEHDAQLNELISWVLKDHPRDLVDWPGKGLDAPLYGLDQPV